MYTCTYNEKFIYLFITLASRNANVITSNYWTPAKKNAVSNRGISNTFESIEVRDSQFRIPNKCLEKRLLSFIIQTRTTCSGPI